jgi:hypothetical protein
MDRPARDSAGLNLRSGVSASQAGRRAKRRTTAGAVLGWDAELASKPAAAFVMAPGGSGLTSAGSGPGRAGRVSGCAGRQAAPRHSDPKPLLFDGTWVQWTLRLITDTGSEQS